MQKLKTTPKNPIVIGITLVAFVTFFISAFVLLPINGRLKSAGYDIVEYELAFTADNADKMLHAWGVEGQEVMRESLFLDFPFLISYALAFSGLTLLIGRAQTGRLAGLGLLLTPAAIIAAICDSIENLILFTTLGRDTVSAIQPLAAGICASIKFLLMIGVIIYWIVCGAAWAVRRLRPR